MPEWLADRQAVVARLVEVAGGHWVPPTPSTAVFESERTGQTEDAAPLTDDGAGADARDDADVGGEAMAPASGPRTSGEEYTAWSPAGVRPLEVLDRAGTDAEARKVLIEVATTICQVEAPIARRRLYVKISRAFGLSRTVKSREESIRAALGEAFAYFDEDGFVWASRDDALAVPSYRRNALDHVDSIEEIPPRAGGAHGPGACQESGVGVPGGPAHVGAQASEREEPQPWCARGVGGPHQGPQGGRARAALALRRVHAGERARPLWSQRDHGRRHDRPAHASTDTMILVTCWCLPSCSGSESTTTFLRLGSAVVGSREAGLSEEWQGGVLPGFRAPRFQKITIRSQLKSPVE